MLLRKAALNLCAAAAVLAFALGAQGDNAGFAGKNQEVTPPPEFSLGARVFDGAVADLAARGANGDLDFQQWLAVRRLQIVKNAEHAFAGALSESALQLSFVKRARVDLQTSLGGRKGAGGVDVAGALRESDDDIVGWQLRAYAGEDSAKGLNSGLFYRRIVNGALAGVNVFADYEDGDDGDFWRWSIGGDVKNRFGELSANHYFAITDAQTINSKKTYTREGYDVDLAARIPRLEWAKARIGYYNFKGEFGDEDETGLRAALDLSPGEGVVFGVEYDGEDGSFGGNISYTHTFGEAQQEPQRAGNFNPRAHFYDAVRREYSQRISRAAGGGGLVIVGAGVDVEVKNAAMTATVMANTVAVNASFPLDGSVTVTGDGSGAVTMMGGGAWDLTLSGTNPAVAFFGGTVMNVASGMGSFYRSGGGISEVVINNVNITLLGTRFDFDNANGNITLYEGGLGIPTGGNVNVSVWDAPGTYVNIGGVTVGCNDGGALNSGSNVRARCNISGGDKDSIANGGIVTAGFTQADVAVGRFTLQGAADGITVSTGTPGFDVREVSGGFNLFILMTTAAEPNPNSIIANMIISGEGHPTRTELFTVRVNPMPLAVSYVGGGTPNTAPLTMGGEITVATLTVANGYANGRRAMIVGDGGNFRLADGTLILGGNNTAARMTAVTIRGRDAHNTDSNSLSITVAVDATPPPLMPVCSAGSNCRTFTVTAHNVSDLVTTDLTVGSVNWRFLLDGRTLQTDNKVLVTVYDNSGVTFTVTDEQVRGMLGTPSGISVTVFNPPSDITITTGYTVSINVAGNNYFVGRTRSEEGQDRAFTVARANIQPSGEILVTLRNINLNNILGANNQLIVVTSNYGLSEGTQSGVPTAVRDYVFTLSVNADTINALRGVSVIAPLVAGGGSDSALLESEFSHPQLWQVSYLSNATPNINLNPNISPPPSPLSRSAPRRPRRNITPT